MTASPLSAGLRVLRVYHAGRDGSHRKRERALVAAGADVRLVVPTAWPEGVDDLTASQEPFSTVELEVARPGDVNRHRYRDARALRELIAEVAPDVLDVHEEPFSVAARQWLRAAPADLPVVMYTAQNVDKRLPPPFSRYEQAALRRVSAFYPCSAQAAAVARGKGFEGLVDVLPLGYDDAIFVPGAQSLDDDEIVLALFGRLVPEKGVTDAVTVLARVNATRPARLVVCGRGPAESAARSLASSLGVADRFEIRGWRSGAELAAAYRSAHVVLVPSRATETWVEQFGRVIVEAQASGAVVAGYDSGAIAETGGAAAVVRPVGDVEGLARGVLDLLAEPVEFERRRRDGSALAADRTWARVAERQLALYRSAVSGQARSTPLPSSPAHRRALARAEFGASASTAAGARPFALPLLRRGGPLVDLVAAACDLAGEWAARLASQSRPGKRPR